VTSTAKKKAEIELARIFIDAKQIPAVPLGRERPDVELKFEDGGRVGLEVTNLTDPAVEESSQAMARLEKETERVLGQARVFVIVGWKIAARLDPDRDIVRAVATALAQLVREMQDRGFESVGGTVLRRYTILKPLLQNVVLFDDDDGPIVSATGETHWADGSVSVVQARLDAKEKKLSEYRKAGPIPQWLLMVTATRPADTVLPQLLPHGHVYRSSFDRAFVLDASLREVVELALAPGVPIPEDPHRSA
jgi:hypothetical protein